MRGWASGMGGWAANAEGIPGQAFRLFRSGQSEFSFLELIGQRLIEDDFGHGFRLGRIEGRSLIEQEVTLGWPPRRRERRGLVREVQVQED